MQNNEDARFIALLEKWQSGDFSRKEARELEELTRDDAFRQEAWEGFQALPEENHQKTIEALRLRLRHKYESKPGTFSFRIMLSAAAVLLLLLATVWLIRTNQRGTELAQLPSLATKDTLAEQGYAGIEEKSQNLTLQSADNQTPESEFSQKRAYQSPPSPNAAPPTRTAAPEETVAFAEDIVSAKADMAIISESEKEITEAKDDTPAAVEESKKALETAAAKPLDKKTPAAPSPTASVKKKAKASNAWSENNEPADMDKLRKEARKKEMPARTEPGGGWEMFNDYLRQNARLTPQAATANVSGTVRLQFSVNDNGEPQGIIVLRSLGYGLDQEARRLIENWVWIKGYDPFISVDIPFAR